MVPKVKIEETLPSGERITITLEGREVSKTRVLQIMEMLSIMSGGGVSDEAVDEESTSIKEKVWRIILERFGDGAWFTLRELYGILTDEEPEMKVTTLASYLAKFVSEGRLMKKGQKPSTLYRVRMAAVKAKG
ncbi:MAG: hypothetical protein QXG48_03290 [Thermofilaceae archaeon]